MDPRLTPFPLLSPRPLITQRVYRRRRRPSIVEQTMLRLVTEARKRLRLAKWTEITEEQHRG